MAAIPYAIVGYGRNCEELQDAIDAATLINRGQILRGRAPLWWDSPARYAREEQATLPGVERIQTAEELHAMGKGDCDDHAPALAASLQVCGIPARAIVIESPGIGYHVIVRARDSDGTIRTLDPSARRGMLMGEARGTSKARRRAKWRAALQRGMRLAAEAAKLNPASAAAQALTGEARRMLAMASEGRRAEEREESVDASAEEAEES